jgi:hypothetical protein
VIKKTANIKPAPEPAVTSESDPERFDRVLSRAEFKPLKDVFAHLGADSVALKAAIFTTNSYPTFLGKLGYRLIIEKQIHENDCYSRLGPEGGIRAVLPLHDSATYSTMVTLVNYNSTVATTAKSVDYYDNQLSEFKTLLMSRSGNVA